MSIIYIGFGCRDHRTIRIVRRYFIGKKIIQRVCQVISLMCVNWEPIYYLLYTVRAVCARFYNWQLYSKHEHNTYLAIQYTAHIINAATQQQGEKTKPINNKIINISYNMPSARACVCMSV